ncbi:hypothetical protein H4R33_006324 [Dimargaris cristalligena]|nr:hypothetical protein H4R33_006324 [Dimargaris cristalligena]
MSGHGRLTDDKLKHLPHHLPFETGLGPGRGHDVTVLHPAAGLVVIPILEVLALVIAPE